MIINGTSIPGIFIYKTGVELERGDFIVYEDSLYICTPLEGETYITRDTSPTPDKNIENFTIYLGGDQATWDDFEQQFNQSSNSEEYVDKIITSSSLALILKRLLFGIDSSGIINEYITKSTNNTVSITPGLRKVLNSEEVSTDNILDFLLKNDSSPEFNNLSLRVDRSLFSGLLPEVNNLTESAYDDIELSSVVLRQYTYYETLQELGTSENKIRVQEVIDHINGVCLYRFIRLGNSDISISLVEDKVGYPSSWKLSCINLDYLSKLDSLLKYIEDEKKKLENSSTTERNRFYFRKLILSEKSISIDGREITYTIGVNETVKDHEISESTITVISSNKNSGVKNSYSMTINLDISHQEVEYAFPNNIKVVRVSSGAIPMIKLILPENISTADIHSLYVKTI